MATALRLGLLLDGASLKGWHTSIIKQIALENSASFVAVVEIRHRSRDVEVDKAKAWTQHLWKAVDKAENHLSNKMFGAHWGALDHAFDVEYPWAELPLQELTGEVRHLVIDPEDAFQDGSLHFNSDELEGIKALQLDILLYLGDEYLAGEILQTARLGIWQLRFGDQIYARKAPAGFRENYEGRPFTAADLVVLGDADSREKIIRKGIYNTFWFSWNENRRRIQWHARHLLFDTIKDCVASGTVPNYVDGDGDKLDLHDHQISNSPNALTTLIACAKIGLRIATRIVQKLLSREQWHLLLCRGSLEGCALAQLDRLEPQHDHFWADPFIIEQDGDSWIYFEDFSFSDDKGAISCLRIIDGGYDSFQEVMNVPYHLSYPFLFRHGGEIYMIPETAQRRTVELWRCKTFPGKWVKVRNLFEDVRAVDTTLLEHDGRWWMFMNIDRSGLDLGAFNQELFIFHTEDDPVNGEWQPHGANPVMVDARRGRMGGAFYTSQEGHIIRSAQRGGLTYGSGLKFLRIEKLTTSEYQETLLDEVYPRWLQSSIGIHHSHRREDISILDVLLRVPRFRLKS